MIKVCRSQCEGRCQLSSKIESQASKIVKTRGVRAAWERWYTALRGGDLLFSRLANAFLLTVVCLLGVWFSFAWHSYQVEHITQELAETNRNWVRQFAYIEGLVRQVSGVGMEGLVDRDLPRARSSAEQSQVKIKETLSTIRESVAQQPGAFSGEVISDINNLQRRLEELGQSVELSFIIAAKNDNTATIRGFRDTDKLADSFIVILQGVHQKLNARFEQLLLEVTVEPWWLNAARSLGGLLTLISIGWAFATTIVMADRAAKKADIQRRLKEKLEAQLNDYEERFISSQTSIEHLRGEVALWSKSFQCDPLPLFQLDTSGQMVNFNDAWLKLSGLSRSEISAGEWRKVLPLHIAEQVTELVKNPEKYKGVHSLISVVRPAKKGARSVPVRIHLKMREADGVLVSEGRVLDLSELYQWKRKSEEQGEELALLVKLASCGVWSLDLGNQHLYWDYPFNDFPRESHSGWLEILSADDTQKIKGKIRDSLIHQDIWQVEVSAKDTSGEVRQLILQGMTHFNEDGFPAVARGIARYVDQVKEPETSRVISAPQKGLSVLMRDGAQVSSEEVDRLTTNGHQVVVAKTADEFVQEAESRDFDLILLNDSIDVEAATLERLMKLKGIEGGHKVPLIVRLFDFNDMTRLTPLNMGAFKKVPGSEGSADVHLLTEGSPVQSGEVGVVDISQFNPQPLVAGDFSQGFTGSTGLMGSTGLTGSTGLMGSASAWDEWPNYDELEEQAMKSGEGAEHEGGDVQQSHNAMADSEAGSSQVVMPADGAVATVDESNEGAGVKASTPEQQEEAKKKPRNPSVYSDLRDHYE